MSEKIININCEAWDISALEPALRANFLGKRMIYSVHLTKYQVRNFLKFIEKYGEVSYNKLSSKYYALISYKNNDYAIAIHCEERSDRNSIESNRYNAQIYTNANDFEYHKLIAEIPSSKEDDKNIALDYFFTSSRGIDYKSLTINFKDIGIIYNNLYPDIDINQLAESFSSSNEPILILYGMPGVGKTTFIKHLLSTEKYKNVAYIKDSLLMKQSGLWSELSMKTYDLLIFDDLDLDLASRKNNADAVFVSELISFSGGLFTEFTKTKIVVTTNQEINEIDSAIVRPGRCYDFIHLHPLSYDNAKNFWINELNISEELFDTNITTKRDITQAEIMSIAGVIINSQKIRPYYRKPVHSMTDRLSDLSIKTSPKNQLSPFAK